MEQIWIKPVPSDVMKLIVQKQSEWKKIHGKTIGLGWATVLLIQDLKRENASLKNKNSI